MKKVITIHISTANKPLEPEPQQQNPVIQHRQVKEHHPPHPLRRSNIKPETTKQKTIELGSMN